jgi:hypothetical protein
MEIYPKRANEEEKGGEKEEIKIYFHFRLKHN